MNSDQIQSLIRQILTFAGAYVIKKGWTDSANWEIIVGALAGIGSVIWSMMHHSNAAQQARADTISITPIAPTTIAAHDTGVPQNPPKP